MAVGCQTVSADAHGLLARLLGKFPHLYIAYMREQLSEAVREREKESERAEWLGENRISHASCLLLGGRWPLWGWMDVSGPPAFPFHSNHPAQGLLSRPSA